MPNIVQDIIPIATASKTQAQLNDPGITYNQGGVSYNDSRYTYGGVYNQSDVEPAVFTVSNVNPSITGYSDIYTAAVVLPGLVPMGLLHDLTYPVPFVSRLG